MQNALNFYSMLKKLNELVFGTRSCGEKLSPPSYKTTMPMNQPSLNQWVKKFHIGRMYNRTNDKFFDR